MSLSVPPTQLGIRPVPVGAVGRLTRISLLRGGAGRVPESTTIERFKLIQAMAVAAENRTRELGAPKDRLDIRA